MGTAHFPPPFLPLPMASPFPLLLLSAVVAIRHGSAGGAGALSPSLFGWGGRPFADGGGPARPSFSPLTPFLTPQSLPPPLFGGRMAPPSPHARKHFKIEEGGATTNSFNGPREMEDSGKSENGQKQREEKELREEERRTNGKEGEKREGGERESADGRGVRERGATNGGMGKERGNANANDPMGLKKAMPNNSSSSSAGAAPIVSFPQPQKIPFDASKKTERAELLVEKEAKTEMERIKKDGGHGEEKKWEENAHNERDDGRTPGEGGDAQNVPLAGRFAPMRMPEGGRNGPEMEENGRRRPEEHKKGEDGRGGTNGKEREGRAEIDRSRGSLEKGSREWEKGERERGDTERNRENRQRERGQSERDEEEDKRQQEKSGEKRQGQRRRANGRDEEGGNTQRWRENGDGRAAEESLLFTPLQGPFPDGPSRKNGNEHRTKEGRGERMLEGERRDGERDKDEERVKGKGRAERWGVGAQQRSRNAQPPPQTDRLRPSADGIGRSAPRHPNSRTSPSSSSAEESVSRESIDGRQHPRAVHQSPTATHSRAPPPPGASVVPDFQRAIPDPNEFFPEKIRADFPPFPKPFEGLGHKHGKWSGEGRESGREREGRE